MSTELLMQAQQPHLILYNARIYTADQSHPWAEAIAILGSTILAIGSNAEIRALATTQTRQIDLQGRLILPGLCDAHIHLYEWAINLSRPQLASARSQSEMLAMIQAYATQLASTSWVVCQGWNESWWGQQDFFTAKELNTVTQPGQPAIAYRSDMHIAVANQTALTQANITAHTPNPPGGIIDRDANGNPTGVLRELAIGLVTQHIAPPTHQELLTLITNGTHALHQLGITAIHDQRLKDGNEGTAMLAAYTQLQQDDALMLRLNCNIAAHQLPALQALGLRSGFGNDILRLGHLKVFADGSLGSRTAWMLEPFAHQSTNEIDNYGVNVTPPQQMAQEFYQAQKLGFAISVHAIGDRANRVVLDIFEEVSTQLPALTIPNRIEHVQTINPDDIARLANLNITASVQPIHLIDDRDLADRYWGDRARNTYAFNTLQEAGVRLAFGSDAPVANPNPFLGIHAALTRRRHDDPRPAWQAQEKLDIHTIIHAYTLGAAQAAGWDHIIGSLRPGKKADIIVLDRDIFNLATANTTQEQDAIADTKVITTIFNGNIVHSLD